MRWNYGKIIFVIMLALILFLPAIGLAGSHADKYTRFHDIEQLYLILSHLEGNELILIKPEANCFCGCWEMSWSCTELTCKVNGQTCQNPPVKEKEEK